MSQLNQVLFHENSRVGADLDAWLSTIGSQGLNKALANPAAIIPVIEEAGLSGLGGSGFPTYRKWQFVADQDNAQDKYLICNGNEDEPGTFKDRILLQEAPHQVIEGACITALSCGINRIIFYINPDQTESLAVMEQSVQQWRDSEFFSAVEKALGKELELTVRPSSGHYIGGEETAAIESVEGKFPFPRGKPPFPAVSGVFG